MSKRGSKAGKRNAAETITIPDLPARARRDETEAVRGSDGSGAGSQTSGNAGFTKRPTGSPIRRGRGSAGPGLVLG